MCAKKLDLKLRKCNFMVKESIVICHKLLQKGLEVDKAKIEVIHKSPPPLSVKGFILSLCMKVFTVGSLRNSQRLHVLYKNS